MASGVTTSLSDPRPPSAVSTGTGLAGLAGLFLWVLAARRFDMTGPLAALAALVACGAPMVLWSLVVDKVHRNPTTGIDWTRAPARLRDTLDVSLVKLGGLFATWGLIAAFYWLGNWYWNGRFGDYGFAMGLLGWAVTPVALAAVPYVIWLDRRLADPRDNAWAFGQLLVGGAADGEAIREHLRQWFVKGFFLAFMLSVVPGNWADAIRLPLREIVADPVALARYLIAVAFTVDVTFATVGYLLTCRPLDAHIRSANPYAAGWVAALICYPPSILMASGGPLDYHAGTASWDRWLQGSHVVLGAVGFLLVALTAVYAWATVAFGLRFSNLTHRGILTHGPYAWTKHPAYVSKTLFWWLSAMPFLSVTGSVADGLRNCGILAVVTGVYYWRARTEERHLSADPAYRDYAAWMDRHGPLPRLIARLTPRRVRSAPGQLPAE